MRSGTVYIAVGVRSHILVCALLRGAAQLHLKPAPHLPPRCPASSQLTPSFPPVYLLTFLPFREAHDAISKRMSFRGSPSPRCAKPKTSDLRHQRTDHALPSRAAALLPRAAQGCQAALQDLHDRRDPLQGDL